MGITVLAGSCCQRTGTSSPLKAEPQFELGFSPPCGPKAGTRVTVRLCDPPGAYPLRDGLQPGDVVLLLHFDHGWWDVQREADGSKTWINILNVGQVLSAPPEITPARTAKGKPDWPGIIAVARQVQSGIPHNEPDAEQRLQAACVESH